MKRSQVKSKCANPLFEQWLEEWKNEAALRNSQLEHCFGKALTALRKYPLPLQSGKDCIILQNFGAKLCSMIDKKLSKYKESTASVRDLSPHSNDLDDVEINHRIAPKKSRKSDTAPALKTNQGEPKASSSKDTEYIPARRTSGYAILLTLYNKTKDSTYIGYMKKAEIQSEAQDLCDTSFTKPAPGSRYTAWSTMSTLIDKGLVKKYSSPAKFTLTEHGMVVAMRLSGVEDNDLPSSSLQIDTSSSRLVPRKKIQSVHSLSSDSDTGERAYEANIYSRNTERSKAVSSIEKITRIDSRDSHDSGISGISTSENLTETESSSHSALVFQPGTFDVILLVDTQETVGGKSRPKDDATIVELSKTKVPFEVRHLKVGDFAWIARSRQGNEELVLPYIVERKRMDDFGSSIKDGRFHEQKFRLKKSGIQNLVYMVESHGNNQHTGLPLSTLYQAATNTLIQDDFTLKYTNSHRDSMLYLATMTVTLTKLYQKRTLVSCRKEDLTRVTMTDTRMRLMIFEDFNKAASKVKNFKVKQMFVRQLLQLKGISVEKALAIVKFYPTPKLLREAFRDAGPNGEKLLAQVNVGSTIKRQLGPALSKTLHQFYTRREF